MKNDPPVFHVNNPATWNDLGLHPAFESHPNWREFQEVGDDPDFSLVVVRGAVINLIASYPQIQCALVVLDSFDWMVELSGYGITGDLGHFEDEKVWVRLDKDGYDSLYTDGFAVEVMVHLVGSHFELNEPNNAGDD